MNKEKSLKKPFYKKLEWLIPITISIALAIFFGGKYIININNSTITDSQIFNGINFGEVTFSKIINMPLSSGTSSYEISYTITQTITLSNQKKYNLYNFMFILPDGKKVFIPEFLNGEQYLFAYSDDKYMNFEVPDKYKLPSGLKDEDICFISHPYGFPNLMNGGSINTTIGPKFLTDEEDCYKPVS